MSSAKSLRLLACLSTLPVFLAGNAFAQSPADEFARDQAQKEQVERLDALKKITPDSAGAPQQEPVAAPQAGGPCFSINRVEVEGLKQFSAAVISPVIKPYENKCVGLGEINTLLRDLTYVYLDKGFITSRAYVPEQDIARTKVLRLIVVEGALSDIYLNSKPAEYPSVLATAFPGMKNRIANIRDIEQGLDQINRLSSNNAKTAMLPGTSDGTSILNVENNPGLPWHFSASNSNLGQKSTGYSKSSGSFSMDNLLNLNDLLSLSYEHTGPDYPWGDDGTGRSNSYSGNVSIPYGYWTFSANGSWYEYDSSVPGNFGSIETSGDSKQAGIGIDRVILRDKDSITTFNSGLTYKETNNFLLGNQIEVGSRQYTVGSFGISHSRRMFGGLWVFDASYDQGLDLFGAVDPGEPAAGNADPRFSKFTGTISGSRPFEVEKLRFELSSIVTGQYSPDNLFGAEQISLGSYSNVRGARESLLFGNDGFFTRNELVWKTMPWRDNATMAKRLGELRPYVGLDYGHVFSQKSYGIAGGDIAGWTAGIRTVGGNLSMDLGYSDIVASSVDDDNSGLFFFNTSLRW